MRENLIERSLEIYEAHQRKRGFQTDEVSFVAGYLSCFGVITGRIPLGLPENTSILAILDHIQREMQDYRANVVGTESQGTPQ
jgi:hypothetical protein